MLKIKADAFFLGVSSWICRTLSCCTVNLGHIPGRTATHPDREPVDPTADLITIDGTLQFCSDIGLGPEDVLFLALAYELRSPRMGEWSRKGWIEGWKALGCVLFVEFNYVSFSPVTLHLQG